MRETIYLQKVENAISKQTNEIYVKIETNTGVKMSAFEETEMVELRKYISQWVDVEYEVRGKYSNITCVYGAGQAGAVAPVAQPIPQPVQPIVQPIAAPVQPVAQPAPVAVAAAVVEEQEVKIVNEFPNSRTIGQGKDQVKIYFSTATDLEEKIRNLQNKGLMPAELQNNPLEKINEAFVKEEAKQKNLE